MYPLRNFFGDRLVSIFVAVQLGAVLILWLIAASFVRPQDAQALLHYTVDFGVNFSGPWSYIYRIPLIGLVIVGVNMVLAYLLFYIERVYTYVLLAGASGVMGILIIDLIVLYLLNS